MAKVSFVKNFKDCVKEAKLVTFGEVEFNVKNYLPVTEKLTLVEKVVSCSFSDDNKYSSGFKDMFFTYFLAKEYTDLKIEDDVSKMYDILQSSGLADFIVENIPKAELEFLTDKIEDGLDEEILSIERENTFVNVIKKFLEDINNNVPEMVKALEEFDPEKLSMIKGMLDFEKGALNKKVKN